MGEAGVDIAGQTSTRLSDADIAWADHVVTVCGEADKQYPVLPVTTRKEHWLLADPAKASGSEAEVLAVFHATRRHHHGVRLRAYHRPAAGAMAITVPWATLLYIVAPLGSAQLACSSSWAGPLTLKRPQPTDRSQAAKVSISDLRGWLGT